MSSKELKPLPADTVRLIGGSQVITSVFSVVKELVENSFDSESTSVEVKLENYGLDRVEVRDNGYGMRKTAIQVVAKRHHTSKISSFNDLGALSTYGFRGEALGSLCSLSNLAITTKTCEDNVSQTYTFDCSGNVLSEKPSHLGQGTTISASNLFKNVPVRRQFYNNVKKKKEELKKVEELLMIYGVVRPDVRIVLKHGKDLVWQKAVMVDTKAVLNTIFGRTTVAKMVEKSSMSEDPKVSVRAFLPKKDRDISSSSRSTNDRCWLTINNRPVQLKDIEKVVKQHYCHGNQCENRFPVCFIHITVPSCDIDVNVDPNKTRVMLHQHSSVIQQLRSILEELYGPIEKSDPAETTDLNNTTDSMLSDSCSDSSFADSFDANIYHGNKKDRQGFVKESSKVPKIISVETKSKEFAKPTDKVVVSGFYKNCDDTNGVSVEYFESSKNTNEAIDASDDTSTLGNGLDAIQSDCRAVKEAEPERHVSEELVLRNNNLKDVNSEKEGENIGKTDKVTFDIIDDELEDLFNVTGEANVRVSLNSTDGTTNRSDENCNNLGQSTGPVDNSDCNSKTDSSKMTEDFSEGGLDTTDELLAMLEDSELGICDELNVKDKNDESGKEVVVGTHTESETSDYTNLIDWSKGLSENQTDGKIIQPVKLLTSDSNSSSLGSSSKKRASSLDQDDIGTPPSKRLSTDNQINQPKLYDMVGRSPADKLSVGFLAFSQQHRAQVVEENPDLQQDEVTNIVRKKWEMLDSDEKAGYDEAGRKHVAMLKKKAVEKKQDTSMQKLDYRLQKVAGLPSIKDQLIAGRKKQDTASNVKPMKSVKVSFCMKSLRRLYNSGLRQTGYASLQLIYLVSYTTVNRLLHPLIRQTQKSACLELIGALKFYNGWMCRHGNKLQVINPHRVEETLLYQELIENHIIPASRLENTIGLNERSIGNVKLYEKLLEMVPSNTCQTFIYIADRRLKANGIEIRCHLDQNSETVLELVGLANCMPTYGVKDLHEILDLIANSGANTVAQSRPLKVQFYLQGEAVRMIRQRPVHRSREDLIELLEQMTDNLPVDCDSCLHNKHFIHTMFDLNDVPVSQNT